LATRVRSETWNGAADIVAGECRRLVDLAGKKPLADRTLGDEPDRQFVQGFDFSRNGT
jgi:hypothetical protein